MGEVYEAQQVQLARRVALKTIRADLAGKPELMARFRREAESAAALGHPNLVQVTDFHDAPGDVPFLVMEMLDGATLAAVLEQESRLDPARAAFIGVQLLAGLAAAHRAGIVHRDVKPANVFLQSTTAMRDLVKVLDFGVAKLALEATHGAKAMTQAGQVLGTLAYMAPEQAVGGASVDARTDVFGAGATLFHALSGVRPFDATEPGGGRTPLERLAPWVHRDLAAVIERALARSPDARWPSAEEMAAALQPFAASANASASANANAGAGAGANASAAPRHVGWDPSAIGRLEAPTGGPPPTGYAPTGYSPTGFAPAGHAPTGYSPTGYGVSASAPAGAVPYGPPPGMGPPPAVPFVHAPPTHAPPYAAMHAVHPRASRPWWLIIVGAVVLVTLVPYALSFLLVRRATNPDTIATNVEREVLKQPKQPCPPPDQCTQSREANDLTYPLCTRKLPKFSPYKPGEMVLAGESARIALVQTDLGGGRYVIRFLTAQKEETVEEEQIAGRLCRPGSRAGSGQTVP